MKNISKIAQLLGSRGGKKSAEVRLGSLSKSEISEKMRHLRLAKEIAKLAGEIIRDDLKEKYGPFDSPKHGPKES